MLARESKLISSPSTNDFGKQDAEVEPMWNSLCFITSESPDLDEMANFWICDWPFVCLAGQQGWKIHVLFCGPSTSRERFNSASRKIAQAGCTFSHIELFQTTPESRVTRIQSAAFLELSDRVRHILEILHATHHFNLVEFEAQHALGFRTIQAKRAGRIFNNTSIVMRFNRCSQLLRESNLVSLNHEEELLLDYCERYAFENADIQLAPSEQLFDYARSIGWQVREQARIGNDLYPHRETIADRLGDQPSEMAREVHKEWRNTASGTVASLEERTTGQDPLVSVVVTYYELPAFLPQALLSLCKQTYTACEVIVIDDGSTDSEAIRVFEEQRLLYPEFRFLRQNNAGLSAARNRGLAEAKGEFFLPMDADNVARPQMIETFVKALRRSPELSALSCYFLAFRETADLDVGRFAYAYCPTGGPRVLGCFRNVFGDANAIFRTADLKVLGGYNTDRDSACEDWELFVKLVNFGFRLDVVPDYLFYYRHRSNSLLRRTNPYLNERRILRRYFQITELSLPERIGLWSSFHGLQKARDSEREVAGCLRYRIADRINAAIKKWRLLHRLIRKTMIKLLNPSSVFRPLRILSTPMKKAFFFLRGHVD